MNDMDKMKILKSQYMKLVKKYGETATEFKSTKEILIKINKKQRMDIIKAYEDIISKIKSKYYTT